MRIAFFADVPAGAPNGVSTSLRSSVDALAGQGVSVELVAPRNGVRSVAIPRRDYRLGLASGSSRRCIGVDLVHVHTLGPLGWAGLRAARRLGVPAVMTWHTDAVAYASRYPDVRLALLTAPRGVPAFRSLRTTVTACLNQFDLVVVPSLKTRSTLPPCGPPVEVIPTAVGPFPPATRDRAAFGLPPDATILLWVGRASTEKNPILLLSAFAELRLAVPDAVLVMVGPGTQRAWLTQVIDRLGIPPDAVRRVPPVPHDRIGDYYRAADLFVFTSTTDTQGLVMAEAEAAGLPVLLVDPDLAHGSRVLAAPSPSALADAMAALARDAGPAGPPAYGQPEFGAALAAAYRSCLENASRRVDSGHTVAR